MPASAEEKAAAAEAFAVAARAAQARSDKQSEILLKAVRPLNESGFLGLVDDLKLQGIQFGWDEDDLDHMYDMTQNDWAPAKYNGLPEKAKKDIQALRQKLALKNAYVIIKKKCQGHKVEHLIKDIPVGRPRTVMNRIHNHFYPDDAAGKGKQSKKFLMATMSNTNTTIVDWIKHVDDSAAILVSVGGACDDALKTCVFLDGLLLPQFSPIKHSVEQIENCDYDMATRKVSNYATNNGLQDLRRSGSEPEARVYNVVDSGQREQRQQPRVRPPRERPPQRTLEEKARLPCPRYSNFQDCRYGAKDCHYSHAGVGGTRADAVRLAKEKMAVASTGHAASDQGRAIEQGLSSTAVQRAPISAPTKPPLARCMLCQSDSHDARACPAAQMADVNLLHSSYMVQDQPANDEDTPETTDLGWASLAAFLAFFISMAGGVSKCFTSIFSHFPFSSLLDADSGHQRRRGWSIDAIYRAVIAVLVIALLCQSQVHATNVPANNVPVNCYFGFPTSNVDSAIAPGCDFQWIVDSGCNRFVTNDFKDFIPGTVKWHSADVAVGSGLTTSPCEGTVLLKGKSSNITISCQHVLYLPKCAKKLLPVKQFVRKGCEVIFDKDINVTLKASSGDIIFVGEEQNGLYYVDAVVVLSPLTEARPNNRAHETIGGDANLRKPGGQKKKKNVTFFGLPVGRIPDSTGRDFPLRLLQTHWAFGHMHMDKIRSLFNLKKGDNPDCAACTVAGARKQPLHETRPRGIRPFYRIHIDLAFTKGGVVFQLYVDDYTRVSYLDPLKGKHEAFEKFVLLHKHLKNKNFLYKLVYVRTDDEFVYSSDAWIQFCQEEGVEHEFGPKYRHDLMGVIERAIQTVGIAFRAMMFQGNAPESDVIDCLLHANVIRNNSPTKANKGWTPKEKEAGMKLGINKRLLKGPIFCLVYAVVYEQQRAKHDPRGVACVYLGYDDHNDQYKVKEWQSGRVYYIADVVFHHDIFPYRANPQYSQQWMHERDALTPRVPVSAPNLAPHSMLTGPRRSTRMHDFYYSGDVDIRTIPDTAAEAHFVHMFGPDPNNWSDALSSRYAEEWIAACLEEKNSFLAHTVYTLVPRNMAKGKKIYKPRPVFKIKINPPDANNVHATIDKFKYRLTIAAFAKTMTQGIDFEEKRASTVRWEATLLLISMAVQHNFEISLIDIKTFFLYGDLEDDVFMEQPLEWEEAGHPAADWICKLNRSMYGLPQAPHCAQKKLQGVLLKAGLRQSVADDCIYIWGVLGDPDFAAIGTHVDDIVLAGTIPGKTYIKNALTSVFEVKEISDPTLITAVQVVRDKTGGWLKLHQGAYVKEILTTFSMTESGRVDTPMDPGTAQVLMDLPMATTDNLDTIVVKKYQKLVGMLIWLHKTRPDLLFTINLLSRFLKTPTARHFDLARSRVLKYLNGTIYFGIAFCREEGPWKLSAQADADLAGDKRTSRSTLGYFAKMGKYGCVSFHSTLERKICTSTQQAETYATSACLRDVIWIRILLAELGAVQVDATVIDTDNQGVHLQSTKQVNHAAAKHFRISQAFIRQNGEDKVSKINKVDTKENASDTFTKPNYAIVFKAHRFAIMGPQGPPSFTSSTLSCPSS